MRRNWNVIRALLLRRIGVGHELLEALTKAEISYHTDLMVAAGYLTNDGGYELTWAGYDMAELIKGDRVWRVCEMAIERNGGGLPSDILIEIARGAIRA